MLDLQKTCIYFSFSRYEAINRLHQEVTSIYRDPEIDWIQVYNAGCTIDDTVLPEHVTEPNDLDRLINGTFRLFLAALPTPPTIVTIARYIEKTLRQQNLK